MSAPSADADSTDRRRPTRVGNSFAGDVWVNVKRWNRKAVRNPTAFLLEIVVGILSLLLFTAVFGDVGGVALERGEFAGVDYVTFLVPAVVMQVTMGSSFTSGMGLVDDLETGVFEKVVVTPMRWTAVFVGKAAAELGRIVVQLLIVVGLSLVMGAHVETGLPGLVGIVLICLLVGLLFMSLSNVIGVLTRDEEVLNAASMLFMFPLLFLSPAFLPLSALSAEVEAIAAINPVTYGVDAVRALVLGRDVMTVISVNRFGGIYDTLVPAFAVLIVLNVLVGAIAVSLLSRASSSRVD